MDILASFFLKNNRYIKHKKSHYLLAVIHDSVTKLPYYFVKKTAFDVFTSQIFHVIYKSMIKLPYYFVLTSVFWKHFRSPPFRCRKFSGPPLKSPIPPPLS